MCPYLLCFLHRRESIQCDVDSVPMPFIRLINFPSVSLWLLEEADAKTGLIVQEICWGQFQCRIQGEEVKNSKDFISTAGLAPPSSVDYMGHLQIAIVKS